MLYHQFMQTNIAIIGFGVIGTEILSEFVNDIIINIIGN